MTYQFKQSIGLKFRQPRPWPIGRMLALYAVGLGSIPGRVIPRFEKWCMLFPCLAFSTLGKSMGVKHTVLPDGQPPTVAFTVLAQLLMLHNLEKSIPREF